MQLLPSHPANQLLPSQPAYLPSHPANLLTLTLSLLPRNRGTALGIVQSEVQEMQLLPSHPANQLLPSQPAYLPSHPANLLTLTLSLLPRNRGTALGIVQSEVQEMQLLPSHPANQLLPSQPAISAVSSGQSADTHPLSAASQQGDCTRNSVVGGAGDATAAVSSGQPTAAVSTGPICRLIRPIC